MGIFTLQEFYRHSLTHLESIYKDVILLVKLVYVFQFTKAKDDGYLIFIEKGVYKVSSIENKEFYRIRRKIHKK